MKIRQLWEIKNRSSLGLAVLGLVALGFGAVLKAHAGYDSPVVSSNGGPWMNAISHPACDPADLCAEWPELGGNTVAVCCISSDAVDTDDPGECRRFLYRRPLSY